MTLDAPVPLNDIDTSLRCGSLAVSWQVALIHIFEVQASQSESAVESAVFH
jgi:hypothetical protein